MIQTVAVGQIQTFRSFEIAWARSAGEAVEKQLKIKDQDHGGDNP
jgi:hypothetical protein